MFLLSFHRELKCLRNKIHTNLMVSYLLAGIMWILNYTVRQQLIDLFLNYIEKKMLKFIYFFLFLQEN